MKSNNIIRGECVAPGVCIGTCRVVLTKADVEKIGPEDIMVTAGVDPNIMDAMYRAAAIITEGGGILNHAAIVCREMKKPCCVNVKDATKILTDGHIVELNANTGEIYILTK